MNETQRTKSSPITIYIVAVVLSVIAAYLTVTATSRPTDGPSASHDLKAEVVERGTLRCAYVVYAPGVIKDPNTEEISGIAVDVTTKMAEKLGLEIEWVEEAAWGTMIEGLQTKRYDLVVGMIWPTAARAKRVEFTNAMWYSVAALYARADETRFNDLNAINDPSVKIAVIDGEISTLIAQAKYPKAELVTLPQTADISQMMLNVVTNKADLTIVTPYQAGRFMESNPGTLKNVATKQPLRYSSNTLLVPEKQAAFKAMINTALEELMNTGEVEEILLKYEPQPNSFYRVDVPFEVAR